MVLYIFFTLHVLFFLFFYYAKLVTIKYAISVFF